MRTTGMMALVCAGLMGLFVLSMNGCVEHEHGEREVVVEHDNAHPDVHVDEHHDEHQDNAHDDHDDANH